MSLYTLLTKATLRRPLEPKRVPFIAAWAETDAANAFQKRLTIPAGALQPQLAAVYDLFPTILAVAGGATPTGHPVDGTGLELLLTGSADPAREERFLMHYPHGPHRSSYFTTWRDGDWKVIYHYLPEIPAQGGHFQIEEGHYQLFNLARDPFEQTNLADTQPAVLRRLMEGFITALKAQDAVYPHDEAGKPLKPELP